MKALDKEVLRTAMEIQDTVLGPTTNFNPKRTSDAVQMDAITSAYTPDMRDNFHAIHGLSNSSWFFHSPLQYWSGDLDKIINDADIITTVNEGSKQSTSVNVTLRHSIVFSGKRFEDHRLVGADALVITLIHMLDSPVGKQWEKMASELALRGSHKWRIYPEDGRSIGSSLYEFRFQPISWADDVILLIIYSGMLAYFLKQVARIRALKSRSGLVIAVTVQTAVSIMSSLTICAIFKIDLSKIPRYYFPALIMMIGLENTLRLINAVITTPSDRPPHARISEALGLTGHVALAAIAQILVFLWMAAQLVSFEVGAFCIFAAIAVIFDFFYSMTFFIAVLSVDVQRTGLSDSLNHASTPTLLGQDMKLRKPWTDSLLDFDEPHNTRVMGMISMVAFICIAQYHFAEDENWTATFSRMLRLVRWESEPPGTAPAALLQIDIHQARTPTAWLRMQDHQTAHEVIQVIKPHATSYIARVYDPLIFVLEGSDRTPNQSGIRQFLPAFYDFRRHQLTPFLLTIVLILAIVSILMNYLLWGDLKDIEDDEQHEDEPLLSVRTLNKGHTLDILLMAASRDGVIATVGLDRWIRIWNVRQGIMSYIVRDLTSSAVLNPFPVLAIAIDHDSNWLALLSAKDKVYLWNIPERRWGPSMNVAIGRRRPAAFFFGHNKEELIEPVVVVRHNGLMSELHIEREVDMQLQICRSPLVSVRPHFEKPNVSSANPPPRIITSSKKGCIHIASLVEHRWVSDGIDILFPNDDPDILSILPLPALSSFLAVRKHTVDLIDISTHKVTHSFVTKPMMQGSLRCSHSTRRRPQCGSVGLASLALAYTCSETGNCIVQSYLPQREGDTICFRDPYTPGSKTCCLWRETVEDRYETENPGSWETLDVGYVVGIRKIEPKPDPNQFAAQHTANSGLRRRGMSSREPASTSSDEDVYEVWSLSTRGERFEAQLFDPAERGRLLITTLGPIQKMGKRSIAVAIGNVVKVITVGNEKFDDDDVNDDSAFVGMSPSTLRRKRPTRLKSH